MKKERGSITIITIVTVLFMLSFLISTYVIIENRRQAQLEIKRETKAIYEKDIGKENEIYEAMLDSITLPRLPLQYKEVEYIESTIDGNQEINLAIKQSNRTDLNFTYDIKISPTSILSGNSYFVGTGASSTSSRFNLAYRTTKEIVFLMNNATGSSATQILSTNTYEPNEELNIIVTYNNTIGERTLSVNNLRQSSTNQPNTLETANIKLFRLSSANRYIGKIYFFKYIENGVILRDMVPCYRKSDGEIGMYDLVEGEFYTNSGTGTFGKGSDV